ncbi:response regulator transcription factor [Flavilitoribacter nigricans]|uniref:Response regulatory domain-containing protein n=1 Tax=Flavilitoribacter nigricans (strain ATCC 23147 / DSM 23189 / NBRC 102662 / NCIMB 1420 / SS-2) TaxID=1122177 RepID=A0A2D0NH45_FLAN2|nr:response regulator transcription factor [Flavilitoribacter nigricans]PHN07811.1 hypothetical protein CRP01_04630 [Flavilitoribacter nigricans DSM 23189 = NBRC 102662]
MSKIRVFIAEDNIMLADLLQKSIMHQPDMTVVGKARNPEELSNRLRKGSVDILLLDIFKPYSSFLKLIADLKKEDPTLNIVIVSGKLDYHFALKTVEVGANAYIFKLGNHFNELCEIILKIHTDPRVKILRLPPQRPIESEAEKVKEKFKSSRAELQVIALMIQGFRSKEIAYFMKKINNKDAYSVQTVHKHKQNIKRKLEEFGVTNDASLGYKVAQWGLLQGDELETFEEE